MTCQCIPYLRNNTDENANQNVLKPVCCAFQLLMKGHCYWRNIGLGGFV